MNQNTEYEKFAQEIYQGLINAEGIHTINVKQKRTRRKSLNIYTTSKMLMWTLVIGGA